MSRPFVQVAGVHDVDEVVLLAQCGVDAAGFPLRLPVHAEDCDETMAAAIIRDPRVRETGIVATCITYETDPEEAVGLTRRIGATMLQLHADMSKEALARVRAIGPELFILKSLVVGRSGLHELMAQARAVAPYVDAFITDTFDPATGAEGATGRVHDWAASRRIARDVRKPLMLAGGLRPSNVVDAIRCVAPAAVDAHTGLEGADGRKDAAVVRAFVDEARRAGSAVDHHGAGTVAWPG